MGSYLKQTGDTGRTYFFFWEIDLNGKPVSYRFAFTVGDSIENCNIILEELNAAEHTTAYKRILIISDVMTLK